MRIEPGAHGPAITAALDELVERDAVGRLYGRDGSLWSSAEDEAAGIATWLGWLPVVETMLTEAPALTRVCQRLMAGRDRVLVAGMGGSSLAPLVFASAFGVPLEVLDSTHPAAFAAATVDERTVVVVASKSGSTLEPWLFEDALFDRLGGEGGQFVAVTDPGTALAERARERGFAAVFQNRPDIGGRFSALSLFGLVPAALSGVPIERLLEPALGLLRSSGPDAQPGANVPLNLGAALGGLARSGRDKLTIVASARLGRIGLWIEQLVAESTGKNGVGIVPLADEALGPPSVYGDDRVFLHFRVDARDDAALAALAGAGHPVITIDVGGPEAIGREMLRLELATAYAGALLNINPFDQPDVQRAKDMTVAQLAAFESRRELDPSASGDAEAVLAACRPGSDYLAILAYLSPDAATEARLQAARTALRDRLGVATQVGFGPRYLHSTGQLHKGGPSTGRFLEVIEEFPAGDAIAGRRYGFGTVCDAQARGDAAALRAIGRPLARITLAQLERLAGTT